MNKKKLWLIVIAVAAAATISAGLIMHFHSSVPNPAKMTGEQIMKFVQSPDFNNMPRESRREFFKEAMDSRVNTYFGLPEEEKTAYLDKVIDEMSAMRSQMQRPNFQDRRTSDPNRRFDPNTFRNFQNMRPAERRAMREQFDPEQMARTRIFFNALRARAQQRGIQMGGFGGGRGGGR